MKKNRAKPLKPVDLFLNWMKKRVIILPPL